MRARLRNWLEDESGAVTVDWVVLTAMVIGFVAAIGVGYVQKLTAATEVVSSYIADQTVYSINP